MVLQKSVSAPQHTGRNPYLGYGENDISICVVLPVVSFLSPFPLRLAHAYLDLRERTLVSREKNGPHVCDVYVEVGWCDGLYVAGGVSKFG